MKNQKLELTWIGKENQPKVEPRVLIEDKSKSYGDENTENMLIHGDNLLALKALEDKFTNKIKCIYIDPPYNTGSAFEHYDDNLEHSIWLNLMKSRLDVLKKLMAPDGSIAVQIGFDEMAYLKILMDEIFGRNNCFGQVAVRMSHSAGMKRNAADKRLIKNTEYILFYYKEKLPEIKPIYEITYNYPVNYYQYIKKFPTSSSTGIYINLIDILYEKFEKEFIKYELKKNNDSIKFLFENSIEVKDFIIQNKKVIVRKDSNSPNYEGNLNLKENEFIEYNNGDNNYYIGMNSKGNIYQLYSLEDKIKKIEQVNENGEIEKVEAVTNLLGDWWDDFYKDMSRVDIEGGVKMKTSKKPERLIYRIFQLLTKSEDIVLDSFLGSGTTCAVAHKMNRRYIGIELGEHCYSLSKVRLDNVIKGDKTGISKIVNWQGGGGYKFYELAPSLLVKDKFNNWIISENYNGELLAKAICKQEKFDYIENSECYWKQGKSSENDYIFVTTNYISIEYLESIHEEMQENESLLICCKTYQEECEDRYDNITIKKIPQAILNNCEYGKDDYSLNVNEILEMNEDDE